MIDTSRLCAKMLEHWSVDFSPLTISSFDIVSWIVPQDETTYEYCAPPGNQTACCSTPGSSCCLDNSTSKFTFKPGYLTAVIDSDGTNRLQPKKSGDLAGESNTTITPANIVMAATATPSSANGSLGGVTAPATLTTAMTGQNDAKKTDTSNYTSLQPHISQCSSSQLEAPLLKVGLAIGVPLVLALVAAVVFAAVLFRRLQAKQDTASTASKSSETHSSSPSTWQDRHMPELGSGERLRVELPSFRHRSGESSRHEIGPS